MSTGWIEAAAKEIDRRIDAGHVPADAGEIADILRRHAPPQPEWRERPTCLGRWDTDKGRY